MHRDFLTSDGLWAIPTEDREKGNAEYIRLPPMVMQIVRKQPTSASAPFIFQGRLKGPINGFTKDKAALDAKMEEIAGHPIRTRLADEHGPMPWHARLAKEVGHRLAEGGGEERGLHIARNFRCRRRERDGVEFH